jgi:anti-sigma factor RsiW
MRDDRTEDLSAWLDGELSPAEAAALERRLEEEPELAALLAELEAVRTAAAALDPRPPERDLWPGIAERIRSGRVRGLATGRSRRRTITFTVPQLAAAAVVLVALGSGAVWTARQSAVHGTKAPEIATGQPGGGTTGATDVRLAASDGAVTIARRTSDDVIADLEQRLAEGRSRLDSSTVRVLEESLATIDRAIGQASQALALDPGNGWLTRHVAEAKARKVRLLERANALASPRT